MTIAASGSSREVASEIRRDGPGEGYKSFRVKTRRGGKSGTAPSPACKVLRKLVTAAIATASNICGSLNPCACKGIGSNPACNPVGQQANFRTSSNKATSAGEIAAQRWSSTIWLESSSLTPSVVSIWLCTATKYVFKFAAEIIRMMCSFATRLSTSSGINICPKVCDSASTTSGRSICSWKSLGTNPNCSRKKAWGWKFEADWGLACKYGPPVSNHSTGSASLEDSIEAGVGSPESRFGRSAFDSVQSNWPNATVRTVSRIRESSNPDALSASTSCLQIQGAYFASLFANARRAASFSPSLVSVWAWSARQ